MSSIYVPDELKTRLVEAARRRGFLVERGRQSQLAEYLEYLVALDERTGPPVRRPTLSLALGLLTTQGHPLTDEDVAQLLHERRMHK